MTAMIVLEKISAQNANINRSLQAWVIICIKYLNNIKLFCCFTSPEDPLKTLAKEVLNNLQEVLKVTRVHWEDFIIEYSDNVQINMYTKTTSLIVSHNVSMHYTL